MDELAELEAVLAGDPATIERLIRGMVLAYAPRLFAVVCDSPDRTDAVILGWGIDCIENPDEDPDAEAESHRVIAHLEKVTLKRSSVERVLEALSRRVAAGCTVRAVWVDEAAAQAA